MKKRKTALITLLIASMTLQVAASTLGTFQYQDTKKTSTGTAEYTIGLINLGSKPLKINFSSETQDIKLKAENITLKPSRIERTPENRGWYQLPNGTYAEIRKHKLEASAKNLEKRNFTVTVSAYSGEENRSGSFNRIVQERTYQFSIVNESYSEGLIQFEEKRDDPEKEKETRRSEGREKASGTEGSTNRTSETVKKERESVNWLLVAGAGLSAAYLVKVILS